MRLFLAAAIIACALPAMAEPEFAFRGQWDITFTNDPGYVGVVLIDGERRVTWDASNDNGKPAHFIGYVRAATKTRIEAVLTNRSFVTKMDCVAEESGLLRCRSTFENGSNSQPYSLTRVGPGPVSLAPKR